MQEVDKTSQTLAVCNRFDAFHTVSRLLTTIILERRYKVLSNIHLYKSVNTSVLELIALETYAMSASELPMLSVRIIALSSLALQLQSLAIPQSSTTMLNADENVAGEVKVSSTRSASNVSVHYKAQIDSVRLQSWPAKCDCAALYGTRTVLAMALVRSAAPWLDAPHRLTRSPKMKTFS